MAVSLLYACVTDAKMYWAADGHLPSIEMAFLNGTERTMLYSDSSAKFTGITLLNTTLYISDETRRYILTILLINLSFDTQHVVLSFQYFVNLFFTLTR